MMPITSVTDRPKQTAGTEAPPSQPAITPTAGTREERSWQRLCMIELRLVWLARSGRRRCLADRALAHADRVARRRGEC